MVLLNELLQPLLQNMGVYFGRRDVGVAKELLQGAQVGAAVEQVAREGMSQHVRAHTVGIEAGFGREFLQVLGKTLAGDMALRATRGKQPLRRDGRRKPVAFAKPEVAIDRRARVPVGARAKSTADAARPDLA